MLTEKLYYNDCHLKTFTATVTGCEKVEKGWNITLSATAFYPEGGGQACDLGALGSAKVLDVREKGETIVHLCDAPLTVGETVEGNIDWERRFDLMQQHTGEHIVSGLLHEKFGCHNVGFHIGADVMEVDFDCNPTPQELAEIESRANEIIWENLPVECGFPAAEELPSPPYLLSHIDPHICSYELSSCPVQSQHHSRCSMSSCQDQSRDRELKSGTYLTCVSCLFHQE